MPDLLPGEIGQVEKGLLYVEIGLLDGRNRTAGKDINRTGNNQLPKIFLFRPVLACPVLKCSPFSNSPISPSTV
jgi:hypothetical protein